MSFAIKLYQNSSEPNRLNKTSYLSDEISINGTCRNNVDLSNPIVLIESPVSLKNHNYMYIQEFNRYYYIEKSIYRNGMWEITAHVDVLMSFKTQIYSCSGIVARNEHLYNMQIIDDRLRFLGYKQINTLRFSGQLKRGESYILAVNGR